MSAATKSIICPPRVQEHIQTQFKRLGGTTFREQHSLMTRIFNNETRVIKMVPKELTMLMKIQDGQHNLNWDGRTTIDWDRGCGYAYYYFSKVVGDIGKNNRVGWLFIGDKLDLVMFFRHIQANLGNRINNDMIMFLNSLMLDEKRFNNAIYYEIMNAFAHISDLINSDQKHPGAKIVYWMQRNFLRSVFWVECQQTQKVTVVERV